MEMGMVGLGRMGGNMALRLVRRGHRVIGYARRPEQVEQVTREGGAGAHSLEELVKSFESKPRIVWVMVPAGDATTQTIAQLADLCERDDIVIDGGNTNWRVALKDAELLKSKGMHYLDAGTSGGIWGLENGYCLMVGGEREIYDHCEPLLRDLAPDGGGLVYTGPEGSGHFVKMVHNGVEYGLMESYAEGFEIMRQAKQFPDMDLQGIAEAWREGSVVRSWLLDLIASGLRDDPQLERIRGYVEDTGEGRWTVDAAIEEDVPAPIITNSLFVRFRSRKDESFAEKMLAMMRHQFGGHSIREVAAQTPAEQVAKQEAEPTQETARHA